MQKDTELTPIARMIATDIFYRFEKISLDGSLSIDELNGFIQRAFDESLDSRQYRKLLKGYSHHSEDLLDLRGFLCLFRDRVVASEKQAWAALRNLGYDEDLYPLESRVFTFAIHSPHQVRLSVDSKPRHIIDLEESVN